MLKRNHFFLLLLTLVTHSHLHAAQMNVEVKEQEEQIELTAQEQAAADKMFEIIHATNKDNAAQQAQALQKLLQRYPRIVYAQNNCGTTQLMNAVGNGNAEIMQLLIAAGAQIEAKNNYGLTALMYAGANGNAETVQLLIAANAQIDAQDNNGLTALMLAVWFGHAEIVKLLIAAGAQLDVKDNDGDTALMYATRNDHAEIVKLLIAAGAQLDVKNRHEETARDLAISSNHQKMYDEAVAAGLAEKKRYEQAQQVAKQKITEVMFPDEIEEPEISEIIGEYAYNPKIPADLPEETPLEKAQRITQEIQEKALSCKREDLPKSPETKQSWWDKAKSFASKLSRRKS